jgi:S-adenosylmethionine hydrolase
MVGSSGYLEMAANQSSAAEMTGTSVGAPVELTLR